MTAVAVVWLASVVAMVWGVVVAPNHTLKGYPAFIVFAAQWVSAGVLAVHALG